MAKKAEKKSRADRPTLLSAGTDQEALRFAGAGSLSDYAKMAFAEGGSLTLTPDEAACSGAGFVQDLMRMDIADPDTPDPGETPPATRKFTW